MRREDNGRNSKKKKVGVMPKKQWTPFFFLRLGLQKTQTHSPTSKLYSLGGIETCD